MPMRLLLGVLLLSMAAPAAAQPAQVASILQRTNKRFPPPSEAQIRAAFDAYVQRQKAADALDCVPTGANLSDLRPATSDALVLTYIRRGEVRNGWTVQIAQQGCPGQDARFLITLFNDGELLAMRGNAGDTLTSLSQFRDTMPLVMLAFMAAAKLDPATCPGAAEEKFEPRILTREADLGPDVFGSRYSGSWQEIWRVTKCGRSVEVPIRFTADGKGGVNAAVSVENSRLLPE
jgi:hypothetical protein